MIRALYVAARERRWNRDRARQIDKMLRREAADLLTDDERVKAMARQLSEIQALPETLERRP